MLRDSICFLLVLVPRLIEGQLLLHYPRGRSVNGKPAEVVTRARRCGTGQSGFDSFPISLRHPPRRLIVRCALRMEERMLAMSRPMCCYVRPGAAGGRSLLKLILLLRKCPHASSPMSAHQRRRMHGVPAPSIHIESTGAEGFTDRRMACRWVKRRRPCEAGGKIFPAAIGINENRQRGTRSGGLMRRLFTQAP
jgi:hypothetical protein